MDVDDDDDDNDAELLLLYEADVELLAVDDAEQQS